MPRSSASLQQRMESMATPAEFGESSTEISGRFPSARRQTVLPSTRMKADLVVVLPRHVIARADVDIFVRQAVADHRLHRFGL